MVAKSLNGEIYQLCVQAVCVTALLLLAGCADIIGLLVVLDNKKPSHDQHMYCEPGRPVKVTTAQAGEGDTANWAEICGWDGVVFEESGNKTYPPGRLDRLMIYKMIFHSEQGEHVELTDVPLPAHYTELGVLHFPKRWYHMQTVEDYIRQMLEKSGGNAVLEFHAYIDYDISLYEEQKQNSLNAYVMRIDARAIRYEK